MSVATQPQTGQTQPGSSQAAVAGARPQAGATGPLRLVRNYIFWSYERGSVHFDIMVTAILLFLFVGPRFINFHDRPIQNVPLHASEVLVKEAGTVDGAQQFIYLIRAEDLGSPDAAHLQSAALSAIEPIAGTVIIKKIEPVVDARAKTVAYNVTALR